MSGSVTDNDACGTDWEKWIPQIDSTDVKYQFTWKPPWKNFRIKICSHNKVVDNTSGFLIPLKMQFLITHHSSTVQQIIRNLESSIVESINSTEELLEIKVKSLEDEDIFTEIERALARETDDIVMKPIQRLKFTSSLVEELFIKELKEQCIDLMRDETNIFIVGFENMKSLITKNIDEINRLTATKVVKLGDKWKIEAVKCFGITETLSTTFSGVVVRLQEETSSVYLKGRDVTINKAEKEVHKLLSDLFNEKLLFDPLTLKLLISTESSEFFNEILQKEHIPVVWTVDSTHLYFFSKTKIDTDTLKAIVYENFLTAGFSKSTQHRNQFCNCNTFIEITKKQHNKLLFLETTMSSVNIAGTKHLIWYLLHQEKVFYNDVGNTKEIQVDTLSFEIASVKDEKMKIDRERRELEVKLNDETQKRKNANDQYQLLERKCKEVEERLKRITLEKEMLIKESRDKEANFIKQLEELKTVNDKQKQNPWASSYTLSRPIPRKMRQHRRTQPSGCQEPDFLTPSKMTGEKKAVSTEQWTVSKMSSSFLNRVVYAKKQNDADSALRSLEESLMNDYKEKLIEDTVIKELSRDQEGNVMKVEETCGVEIEINKRIGRIKVRGLKKNLSEAMDDVHKILRDIDRQKQKQQHAKLVANMVQWYFISVEDTGQKLEEYPPEVNLLLEQALKNNEPQALYLDNSGNTYIVDFTNYEEYPEDDPSDTVAVLRKSKMTDCAFDMPSNWASMDQTENIKIVPLQPADKEYQDVGKDFQTNMTGNYNRIIKIEKIQNRTLQQQYVAKKKSMDSTNTTGTNNERNLWHGTVDNINTYGFNRSYCGKNAVAYGKGVYFAVNPTYSAQAQYARPELYGNKRMYRCKVLVGEFTKGQGGMNVPPPKPGVYGGHILYDSVVDNPQCPGIFVKFHDTQAYPEYIIVFK